MKYLLTRFGGIGDCFPAMGAAQALANEGHDVTLAVRDDGDKTKQSFLFQNVENVKVIDLKEVGPWRDRCVKTDNGYLSIQSTYKEYDEVVDFMNIVENNSTCPTNQSKNHWQFWQRSRNSNWVNWYDLHLMWCNLDPEKTSTKYKRPQIVLSDDEKFKAAQFKAKNKKLFVIHPYASSLARSWYQAKDLVMKLLKEYPECGIAFWNPNDNNWDFLTKKGPAKLTKLDPNPIRESLILLAAADLVVTVDTGCGHMAEGVGTKNLVIYSTVPAWTRNAYYRYQTHIDLGENNPEFYTFSLALGDPLRIQDGMKTLSEREQKVLTLYEKRAEIEEAMEVLNTDAQGAELELKILMARKETWERQQSKALSAVTVDMVFDRIKGLV